VNAVSRRRADAALVEAGLFASREQAKAAILAGRVTLVGAGPVLKAGADVPEDAAFEVEPGPAFVSRGGVKLAGALDAFGLDVSGVRAIDVGASTGGFTDCLLQRGAAAVTALDVGYGQLAWKLRCDERVTVLERTNIRSVDATLPGAPFGLAVIDVSFIGLSKVLPHVRPLLAPGGTVVALVKPQFEAGKARVGKRGVVRDADVHTDVLETVVREAEDAGFVLSGMTWSPITGPEGNIEFWMRLETCGQPLRVDPAALVSAAHDAVGGR
jgi:23S rRNA (cytidine1920-2'-O)/16S rRNA (cytidine1409-2'-O)-methyltransferase